jgi:hypothetical protein
MKEIPLSGPKGRGLAMRVSDEDYELMSRIKWYAKVDQDGSVSAQGYVSAHSFITGYRLTDHANGNKLDNTRDNLREATPRQNSWNRGRRSDAQTGYKGIRWIKSRQRFRARIVVDGKRIYVGWFISAIDAARAYDAMARKHYGEFARLNFPGEPNHELPQPPARNCARSSCGKEFRIWDPDATYCSQGCADFAAMPEAVTVHAAYWSRAPRSDSRTGYKGVGWSGTKTHRWQAKIMRNGRSVFLGSFGTPEEAARAYDAAALELFGEHAWLNFPEDVLPTVQGSLFDDDELAA